tara:strand:- start:1904 stop:2137 length:234 start_codon:yes stop_codon:yes gene_type:complete
MTVIKAENLDALFELMRADKCGDDWSDLPRFGGPWPDDTAEIWSWDETRMITGTDSNNLTIETREAVAIWQKEFRHG